MTMIEKMLNRLPDAYNKSEQSGIFKTIKLASDQLAAGEKTLETIQEWRDIDQAQGSTLTKIGKDVGQPREGLDDEQYRQKIKIKIRSNLSGGEIETLNSIALVLLSDRFDGIQEGWDLPENHPIGPTPAMMLFTVKADGVNYGIPMAEIDEISAGGVAANWELLIENDIDFMQTDYQYWMQRYNMSNEIKTETAQQNGSFGVATIDLETRYGAAEQKQQIAGEQQGTLFYYPQIEANTQYIVGLHNLPMAGTSKAGEGVIL